MLCIARPCSIPSTARQLRYSGNFNRHQRLRTKTRAGPERQDEESTESLFAKELKRRGIPQDPLNPNFKSSGKQMPSKDAPYEETEVADQLPVMEEDQLRRSRLLNSEGLEGLLPRVRELLTLGVTSTFAFIPAIGIVILIALSLYTLFGESLVHFGNVQSQPPQYVDPYDLLDYPYIDQ